MNSTFHIRILAMLVVVSLAALLAVACSSVDPSSQPVGREASASVTPTFAIPERYAIQQPLDFTITLTTTSVGGTFGRLDRAHSCERTDTSPHLAWEGVPEGAESLALVVEDPASDVHGLNIDVLWTHWVLYSIPPDVTELEPGQVAGEVLGNGAKQGANDYERVQYNGPCPIPTLTFPFGNSPMVRVPRTTRQDIETALERQQVRAEDRPYYFKLYALDIPVDLPSGADRDTLLEAIDGHILAAGELPINYKSIKAAPCRSREPELCFKTVQR